ncbi:MAG TPA: RNase adapter RapZ [Firmicutes bacterium]|nr:RNase adapter RapZ [Bacillota bacterium]
MELIIITGMSGAGKSGAIKALEDIGFYCVDNMPARLISQLTAICAETNGAISRTAVVTDMRGGALFHSLFEEIQTLDAQNIPYKILFLDADDATLMRRYKETRRKHPLIDRCDGSIEQAIKTERKLLSPVMERADYVIDTSILSVAQLKERVSMIFLDNAVTGMLVTCESFGFKYGPPHDADLIFDVRCLPNPFYIPALKHKTGLDREVSEYVMDHTEAQELYRRIEALVDYSLPLYLNEGKSQLTIAFGCTGGKHRSVTFAEKMYKHLSDKEHRVVVAHRDIIKV